MFVKSPIKLKEHPIIMVLCGAISGIGNGIGSVDGPPVVFYLSGIGADKIKFKNTMVTHSLVMGVMGFIMLLFMDVLNLEIASRILIFTVGALIGVYGGVLVSKRINEFGFQIVILLVLFILDIRMIFFS
jgi:uncharacterized membrane protein YfcA